MELRGQSDGDVGLVRVFDVEGRTRGTEVPGRTADVNCIQAVTLVTLSGGETASDLSLRLQAMPAVQTIAWPFGPLSLSRSRCLSACALLPGLSGLQVNQREF